MEDSIKSSSINNRKIIMEIRYEPNLDFIDRRGNFLSNLKKEEIIKNSHWALGLNDIKLYDTKEPQNNRKLIYCDINRLSMSSSKIETNASFSHFFDKTHSIFKTMFSECKIIRIGCRIQGTYKCKNTDYLKIVENFKLLFPQQFFLDDFEIKDMKYNLIYQNGQYHIGPINKDDGFIKSNFSYDEADMTVGFGIDTDNYMVKDLEYLDEKSMLDVYRASLSVEKRLFDNLSIL
ncbi:MAG: hypothetical protein AB7V07_03205 [Candidatus Delongbacteria bacterium]